MQHIEIYPLNFASVAYLRALCCIIADFDLQFRLCCDLGDCRDR